VGLLKGSWVLPFWLKKPGWALVFPLGIGRGLIFRIFLRGGIPPWVRVYGVPLPGEYRANLVPYWGFWHFGGLPWIWPEEVISNLSLPRIFWYYSGYLDERIIFSGREAGSILYIFVGGI